ncbi:GPI mannosyltransferase 2 [Musca domestica]|uniref:GPI mannosyltransferase 2 n=1 Tax=Musca domestica TaxID=7370 RepID=A0A9J7I9D5_MUSDO|nr:GPI mannosyltransferase 2 [Musca domestica]
MAEKVTKLAFASRVIVMLLQLLANKLIPDHKADVFRAPLDVDAKNTWLDKTITFALNGFRHWDAEYFLHIAEYGYTYENTLAFYPLYPMLVKSGAYGVHFLLGNFMNLRSCCLLVGVVLNVALFCKAANILYALTQRIFNDLNKSWNVALLFCFNPASIFFTAAYSETVFCLLSLYVMLECSCQIRVVRAAMALALNVAARSNGLVNLGFPIYFIVRKFILKQSSLLRAAMKVLCCLVLSLLPLTFFNFYAFRQFCAVDKPSNHSEVILDYARERKYVLSGYRYGEQSPWCDDNFPFPYSYIQSHYWHVGFLKYYQWKQLPNFMLASPILLFMLWHCIKYLYNFLANLLPKYPLFYLVKEYKTLPYIIHAFALTVFCVFFVHIQISTRLLCSATPCVYWFASDYMPKSLEKFELRSKAGLIFLWFASYVLVGTIMFSNNLPWT